MDDLTTGHGVKAAAEAALAHLARILDGATVAIEGFGKEGAGTARACARAGAGSGGEHRARSTRESGWARHRIGRRAPQESRRRLRPARRPADAATRGAIRARLRCSRALRAARLDHSESGRARPLRCRRSRREHSLRSRRGRGPPQAGEFSPFRTSSRTPAGSICTRASDRTTRRRSHSPPSRRPCARPVPERWRHPRSSGSHPSRSPPAKRVTISPKRPARPGGCWTSYSAPGDGLCAGRRRSGEVLRLEVSRPLLQFRSRLCPAFQSQRPPAQVSTSLAGSAGASYRTSLGYEADEIADGPGPAPTRQMCVRDPDGHGHMVAELFEGSVGADATR
jgi:hypothetical protein